MNQDKSDLKALIHEKDTEFRCRYCGDHFATCNKDLFSGDLFERSCFYEDKGQAPFMHHEKVICKKCNRYLRINDLIPWVG